MAKNKSGAVPHYELLFIVSNKYSDEEAKAVVENSRQIIASNGGVITYEEEWGKKKLCYPIKNFHYGYYFLIEFDCADGKVNKINDEFRLSHEVLRHLIVARKKRSEAEIKEEKAREEKRMQEKIQEKIQEEKQEEAKIAVKPKEEKVDIQDLDEKLDRILETDDLL